MEKLRLDFKLFGSEKKKIYIHDTKQVNKERNCINMKWKEDLRAECAGAVAVQFNSLTQRVGKRPGIFLCRWLINRFALRPRRSSWAWENRLLSSMVEVVAAATPFKHNFSCPNSKLLQTFNWRKYFLSCGNLFTRERGDSTISMQMQKVLRQSVNRKPHTHTHSQSQKPRIRMTFVCWTSNDAVIENRPTRIPATGFQHSRVPTHKTGPSDSDERQTFRSKKPIFLLFVFDLPCHWGRLVQLLAPIVERHRFRCPKFWPPTTLATAPTSHAYSPPAPKIYRTWPASVRQSAMMSVNAPRTAHKHKFYSLFFD